MLAVIKNVTSYVFGLVFITIALIGAALFRVYRYFIGIYLSKKYACKIKFLKGVDAVFCFDSEKTPYFNQIYHLFKGVANVDEIRYRIRKHWLEPQKIDGRWKHQKLRSELKLELGYYFWIPKLDFRFDDHVIEYDGSHIRTKDDYHRVLQELGSSLTLAKRIFWQFVVIQLPNGVPGQSKEPHFILFFNLYHGVADGVSVIRLNMKLFDDLTFDPKFYRKPVVCTTFVDHLLHWANVIVFGLYRFIREKVVKPKLVSLGTGLTGSNVVSVSSSISLEKVKEIKRKTGTTVNDILVSCVLAAFNRFLVSEKRSVSDSVKFNVPINLHDFKNEVKLENKVSFLSLVMCPDVTSPVDCLMRTKRAMDELKQAPEMYVVHYIVKCLINSVPKYLTLPFAKRFYTTAVVSNIPTSFSGSLCGNEYVQTVPLGTPNSLSGCGIIIGMMSDTETVNFAIKADTGVMKTQERLDTFVNCIIRNFDDLYEATVA